MQFIVADQHFWHKNILWFCKRPFSNIFEMNEEIIRRHNSVVGNDDEVYMLGDFAIGSKEWNKKIFNRLNGKKYLILGNHDGTRKKNLEIGFIDAYRQLVLPGGILLIHDWKKADINQNYIIHGHCHTAWKYRRIGNRQFINVGVDVREFRPVLLDSVIKEFE